MLQVFHTKKKIGITVASLVCVLSIGAVVSGAYVNTNRDTRKAPDPVKSDLTVTNAFELLYEAGDFEYYFREDRDIIAVKNKKTGFVWKTGLDLPFNGQIKDAQKAKSELQEWKDKKVEAQNALKAAKTQEEKDDAQYDIDKADKKIEKANDDIKELLDELGYDSTDTSMIDELANTPKDTSFNSDAFMARANSLITVQYMSGEKTGMSSNNYASSAAADPNDGESSITKDATDGSKWKLTVNMKKMELGFNVYITFTDDGNITYDIPYEEMGGDGLNNLLSVMITPYLGASGGEQQLYNPETGDYDIVEDKELTPGYAFIPDGSGALVRFTKNNADFTEYNGYVYGQDPAEKAAYKNKLQESVPLEDPAMPVFGISHGDGTQSAFVSYATQGDEYMSIVCDTFSRKKNQVRYSYVYPKFTYNFDYFYVINQAGATYRRKRDTPNKFDVSVTYSFLYGDGSDGTPKADYTGMALKYRQHLIDEGILTEVKPETTDVPIRLDFLMSDSKNGVISTTQVTMTDTDDVQDIITKALASGVKNINSGLIGWQKNGETLSKPGSAKYSSSIGTEKEISSLISKFAENGVDISLSREFATINKNMTSYYNVAAKHTNTQYMITDKSNLLPDNAPVNTFAYALPSKSAEWISDLYDDVKDFSNSFTIAGISNILVSSHNQDDSETTVKDAIKLYQDAVAQIKDNGTKINMDAPNQYLWKYTDRYLQSPVGSSQYVYETDTVPFLQMVLHGTMEVYAPYSNFSFYSTEDMLKMIDYNISPSFVLTKEPSYMLASTTSSEYYSTEYDQYETLISSIYATVNDALSQVSGYEWVGRTVLEDGIIENRYSNGTSEKVVIINYTDESYGYYQEKVDALSAKVTDYVDPTTVEGGAN